MSSINRSVYIVETISNYHYGTMLAFSNEKAAKNYISDALHLPPQVITANHSHYYNKEITNRPKEYIAQASYRILKVRGI